MIGNDIVDLTQARKESNWRRKGFLEKIFTADEQHLINTSADPEHMVWLLWSMKESAYKASFRQTRLRRFAPRKISCQLLFATDTTATGRVFYENVYQTKTIITPNYISSLAFLQNNLPHHQTVIQLKNADYSHQSAQIRQKLLVHTARAFATTESDVHFRQSADGIPDLLVDQPSNEPIVIPVSISHHGYYGAYVIGWPNCSTLSY
ncbi:4'-phosphopantetheinyl transferase family protein [Spirosoma gilvum]